MDDLIRKLEGATEENRELFEAAYVACFGEPDWGPPDSRRRIQRFLDLLAVGAWTDAALMLIQPPWSPSLISFNTKDLSSKNELVTFFATAVTLGKDGIPDGGHVRADHGATAALAIVSAALKAHAEITCTAEGET